MKKIALFLLLAGLCASSCSKFGYIGELDGTGYMSYPGPNPEDGPHIQISGDRFYEFKENPFVSVAETPVSSFSVDADGAAYAYMRRSIRYGSPVPVNSVRIEEYLNYFTFDYPEPASGETLGINAEAFTCPWAPEHLLIRLGLKGKTLPENKIPSANFIFLIDTSGSMYGNDRLELVKTGLCAMVDAMRPDDRVAIITYSGSVKRLVESTLISKGAESIKRAIRSLNANGGTAGGPAMQMAYDEAKAHFSEDANNRIIMCTDGDFNVGVSSTDALVEMVESYQEKGIYLSIMGFGQGNFQDSRMENLSNHGNGTYTYIDSEEEMMKVFVQERSHFYSVANDTKCQVRFNPEVVESYRLIGYENRVMTAEEFEDSKKDAGEIGAGQTVTALYELVLKEGLEEGFYVGDFEARYKYSLKDAESHSLTESIGATCEISPEFTFAAGVAAYGLVLLDSEYKADATLSMAKELVAGAAGEDSFRKQLVSLIEKAGPRSK